MPTVLHAEGMRVAIYPNDHRPAHVHVLGAGWVVVITLVGPEIREAIGCDEREARRALGFIASHQAVPMNEWRRFHG